MVHCRLATLMHIVRNSLLLTGRKETFLFELCLAVEERHNPTLCIYYHHTTSTLLTLSPDNLDSSDFL